MSLEYDVSTEVKYSKECFLFDSTDSFVGKLDGSKSTIRDELKKIRAENPDIYNSLSLEKFD